MALTDQPYLPLYVKDWLTNNKLKMCSLEAHGILINVMCIMHKEDQYGTILLKQKFKQSDKQAINFAAMLNRLLPFNLGEIESGLDELLDEKALYIDGDLLICKRMVKAGGLSKTRADIGSEGGKKTQEKLARANSEASTVIVNESESEINYSFDLFWNLYDKKVGHKGKLKKKWDSFSQKIRIAIMQYIPKYKEAKPHKQFRKDPQTFFNNNTWEDELIQSGSDSGIPDIPDENWLSKQETKTVSAAYKKWNESGWKPIRTGRFTKWRKV